MSGADAPLKLRSDAAEARRRHRMADGTARLGSRAAKAASVNESLRCNQMAIAVSADNMEAETIKHRRVEAEFAKQLV